MKSLNNIPSVSVYEMIEMMLELYVTCLKKGIKFAKVFPRFLWGPPGIGKSQAIKQFVKCLERITGKKCILKDIRVTHYDPTTFAGLPAVDRVKQATVCLRNEVFDLSDDEEIINIIFLDELSTANPELQKVVLQLVLDRMVGQFQVPDNTIIIAAGNRVVDRCGVYPLDRALSNRFHHFEITTGFDAWEKYAIENNFHELVVGFLKFDHGKLNETDAPSDHYAYATPRSWESVSDIIYLLGEGRPIKSLYSHIAGAVGNTTALEFITWCNTLGEIPDVDEIFEGKKAKYPASTDELYKLIQRIVTLAKEKNEKGEFLSSYVGNIVRYAIKLPKDFVASLFLELGKEEEIRRMLWDNHMYRDWMKMNGVI